MARTSMERQLAALQASKTELEAKLREKDAFIERLEGDRRWLAEREKEEREGKGTGAYVFFLVGVIFLVDQVVV